MNEIEKARAAEIAALKEHAEKLIDKTTAGNTKRVYLGAWQRFQTWAAALGLEALPANPETIGAYLTHLDKLGRKPATLSLTLTAINQAHVLTGLKSPIDARVRKILAGSKRAQGTAQRQAQPITVAHLRQLIKTCPGDFPGVRNRAILLVGWCAALRRSELAALNVEDIEERGEGLVLNIRRSKTDQEGAGFKVGIPFVDNEDLCPVRALRRWLDVAGIKEGAIFRRVRRGSKGALFGKVYNRLNDKAISTIIKRMIQNAGYDADQFSGHSLRAGLATAAAAAGIPERSIMKITGHETAETLRRYIRDGRIFTDNPVKEILK